MKLLKKKDKAEKEDINVDFLREVQPQGGVKFEENYTKKGDGYEVTVSVYDTPRNVDDFWLQDLMNMSEQNNIVTIDLMREDKVVSINNINAGISEQLSRENEGKATEVMDASGSTSTLSSIYNDIAKHGEAIMHAKFKIHINAKTEEELKDRVTKTMEHLESNNFRATVFLNEEEYEYQSLFLPYEKQLKLPNRRQGKEIPSTALAASLPFSFSSLSDPFGSYLGMSFTSGKILFDFFHKDEKRKFFNGVCVGTMGAGKSTTLKKITLDNAIRGNFIRGFDVVGEFEPMVKELGGRHLSLSGEDGLINPLHIQRSFSDNEKTVQENEEQNYMGHLSKLRKFYQFISGDAAGEEVNEFAKLVRTLYEETGFIERKGKGEYITGLEANEYPIFSDLLSVCQHQLYEDVSKRIVSKNISTGRQIRLERIELQLETICEDYHFLFNGHSSMTSFFDEQVTMFKIRGLSKLPTNIFNAQMFNALNLLWENLLYIGQPQYDALYDPNQTLHPEDITKFLIVLDEAHKIINTNNPLALDYAIDIAREARKYFGGLLFASQSFRDFVPENSTSDAVEKIKTLFELTQYKFVMQQDPNGLKALRQIFEGQLSDSEINTIPVLNTGECILSINGYKNLIFKVDTTDEELQLFKGGL